MKRFLAPISALLILTSAALAQAKPNSSDIEGELLSQLSKKTRVAAELISFEDIGFKVFYDEATGTGRVSAGGSWSIAEDMYDVAASSELLHRQIGVDGDVLTFVASLAGEDLPQADAPEIFRVYTASTPVRFRAEVQFIEHYDFFNFDTKLETIVPDGIIAPTAGDVPASLSKQEARLSNLKSKYREIADGSLEAGVLYRAAVGTFTVTIPDGGALIHRASAECVKGEALTITDVSEVGKWRVIRVGADRAGDTITVEIKPAC